MQVPELRHPGYTPRRTGSLASYERVLARAGFTPVAGIDEAGRGACAGPLVVAAVALNPAKLSRLSLIADSKTLTAAAREQAYGEVMSIALAWHVIVIPPAEIDSCGLHVCNLAGMRRALAGLGCRPAYVLTDGFPVRGLGVPALAMWKGDEVAACVAAASVVAKVTRDRMMCELHTRYPQYGFARHKGYATRGHMKALNAYGPCPEHRVSFVNVGSLLAEAGGRLAAEAGDQFTEVGGRSGTTGDGLPGAAVDGGAEMLEDGLPEAAGCGQPEILAGSGTGPEGLLAGEVGGPAMISPGVRDAVLSRAGSAGAGMADGGPDAGRPADGGAAGGGVAGGTAGGGTAGGGTAGGGTAGGGTAGGGVAGGGTVGGGTAGGGQGDAAASRLGGVRRARPDREEVLVEVGRLPLGDADQEN